MCLSLGGLRPYNLNDNTLNKARHAHIQRRAKSPEAILTTDWQTTFQAHFPIVRERRYTNIAYTSPLAPAVSQAVAEFFDSITYGLSDKPQWLQDAEHCRVSLATLLNGDARRIAFTKNTCEALNLVAQGLSWKPGENLVINDQEHPSNLLPWLNLRRNGVEVRTVRAKDRRIDVDAILSRIDERTRLVAVSWVQSTSGQRIDLDVLSSYCRARGVLLVVDGIQGLGLLQLDLKQTPIDAFACGSHKGLLGPLGLGFLHASETLLDQLEPAYLGPSAALAQNLGDDGWTVTATDRLDARRLENGNLNYPAIAGLTRSLALIGEAGPARIERWVTDLNRAFATRLRATGMDVITPDDPLISATTTVRTRDARALNERLRTSKVIASVVENDFVRFAFGAYNTHADVDAIAALLS
jgi:selenocysteine lyase/cysteine desulfurase